MKNVVRLLTLIPFIASPGCQSSIDIQVRAFESLISAERAFAATSVATDTRTAFLANFAPDGVVFDSGPVNARSLWEQRPEGGPILHWGPEIADVSEAGDMGYTSGPYEVRMTPDEDAVAWGHFISVWRTDAEGTWKVAADGGVAHGPASLGPDSVVEWVGGGADMTLSLNSEEIGDATGALRRYDALYSRSVAEDGFTASLANIVDPSARFFRNGHHPLVGRELSTSAPAVVGAVWTDWEMTAVLVSESGDLGCTFGVVDTRSESDGETPSSRASYYRIWKHDGTTRWRVVVDVLIPIPPTSR